ncbi:MAG: cell division protein CrgA [Nakamurella sp.]
MPKSKVRKKPQAVASHAAAAALAANTARAKVAGPSSPLYIGIMVGLMVLGLVWLVAYYLWPNSIPGMSGLHNWNFAGGFAVMIVGLIMTMRWR